MKKLLPLDAQVLMPVFKSNDYKSFVIMKGNRRPNQLHIRRLVESFKDEYLITPIIVNHKMQIIDGQHRFLAAQQQNLPIYFIQIDGYELKQVHTLNTSNSNWKKVDYLESYCKLGYDDYIQMKEFMEDYPEFGLNVTIMLLTNNTQGSNQKDTMGGKKKKFEQGQFKVNNLKQAYANAKKIMEFKQFYEGYNRQSFVAAMLGIFKNKAYEQEEMVQKLAKNQGSLVDCTSINNYRLLIEEIYNFRRREKVNLRY
jgi:hypothetical protein